jgi:hypothetical protein
VEVDEATPWRERGEEADAPFDLVLFYQSRARIDEVS